MKKPTKNQLKSIFYQICLITLFVIGIYQIVDNVSYNLNRHNIVSGFDFLNQKAGFTVIMNVIAFDQNSSYLRAFFVGLTNTLIVSFVSIIFATILGFTVGVSLLSKNWLLSKLSYGYVEILRNTPLLLQMFFWYFGILRNLPSPRQSFSFLDLIFLNNRGLFVPEPSMNHFLSMSILILFFIVLGGYFFKEIKFRKSFPSEKECEKSPIARFFPMIPFKVVILGLGIGFFASLNWDMPSLEGFNFAGGITVIPEFFALFVSLTLYTAAFIAEVVRSGVMSIPKGQTEAAITLGLNSRQIKKHIILPQAMKVIIPQLSLQYLNITKNSSLGTAIAYPELMNIFAGTVLNQTGQAIEVISITLLVYLTISITISLFMGWYNQKAKML